MFIHSAITHHHVAYHPTQNSPPFLGGNLRVCTPLTSRTFYKHRLFPLIFCVQWYVLSYVLFLWFLVLSDFSVSHCSLVHLLLLSFLSSPIFILFLIFLIFFVVYCTCCVCSSPSFPYQNSFKFPKKSHSVIQSHTENTVLMIQ